MKSNELLKQVDDALDAMIKAVSKVDNMDIRQGIFDSIRHYMEVRWEYSMALRMESKERRDN